MQLVDNCQTAADHVKPSNSATSEAQHLSTTYNRAISIHIRHLPRQAPHTAVFMNIFDIYGTGCTQPTFRTTKGKRLFPDILCTLRRHGGLKTFRWPPEMLHCCNSASASCPSSHTQECGSLGCNVRVHQTVKSTNLANHQDFLASNAATSAQHGQRNGRQPCRLAPIRRRKQSRQGGENTHHKYVN
jgi:hypothetical protein